MSPAGARARSSLSRGCKPSRVVSLPSYTAAVLHTPPFPNPFISPALCVAFLAVYGPNILTEQARPTRTHVCRASLRLSVARTRNIWRTKRTPKKGFLLPFLRSGDVTVKHTERPLVQTNVHISLAHSRTLSLPPPFPPEFSSGVVVASCSGVRLRPLPLLLSLVFYKERI